MGKGDWVGVGEEKGTYQVTVLGEHEIWFDVFHAQVNGQTVGLESMLRQVSARYECVYL